MPRRSSMAIACIVASIAISLITIDQACADTDNPSVEISEASIQKLMGEISQIDPRQSASRLRREYKSSIRDAQGLVEAQPTATNRYRLLYSILRLQKRLLSLDRSERTRSDLFETCSLLAEAPDRYAEYRFDADMLLSDRALSLRDGTLEDRAVELRSLVGRYRDTPGEMKSLMIAMDLAEPLHDMEGKSYYFKMIQERFADNIKGISFIRKHIGLQSMDIIFAGKFERNDGVALHFPHDRMGHDIIAVFWSTKDADYKTFLSQLKDQQDAQPGRFEIYSFNLDDLDDAGASIVKTIGLKCSVMKLPGGINSETFRTYAFKSPKSVLVNEYGRTISEPEQLDKEREGHTGKEKGSTAFTYPTLVPSHVRSQMQLQSLLNGDFFIQADKSVMTGNGAVPAETMSEMQSSIPAAPFRYRLSPEESYSLYSKLENLSSTIIREHPDAPELWRSLNFRIIALMGMWGHTGEPEHLEKAVAESRTLLSKETAANAGMVARYCLARYALRENVLSKRDIITNFVEALGGDKASPSVTAAASILALNANAVDPHDHYRELFMNSKSEEPYSVLSFLRNRHHRYYLFQGDIGYANLGMGYRALKHKERRYIINNDISVPSTPFPTVSLKKLDGSEMLFPGKNRENTTIVMFLEPPTNGTVNLDPSIYKLADKVDPEKKKRGNWRPPTPSGIIHGVSGLAEGHVNKGVDMILAFLSDDIQQIKALNEKYKFPCEVVLVPSGLKNPIVRSLDIFSADRTPNIFFVRRDGTVPWYGTGFPYRVEPHGHSHQAQLSLRTHIFRSDVEAGYRALKSRDFKKAKVLFSGPYLSEPNLKKLDSWRQSGGRTEYHKWTASQHYGKTLAHIGLEEWEEALKSIDKANVHHMVYFRHDDDRPCSSEIGLHKTHALILDQLGRKSEARGIRSKASVEPTDYPTDYFKFTGYDRPYETFNKKLNNLPKQK